MILPFGEDRSSSIQPYRVRKLMLRMASAGSPMQSDALAVTNRSLAAISGGGCRATE